MSSKRYVAQFGKEPRGAERDVESSPLSTSGTSSVGRIQGTIPRGLEVSMRWPG
jgi:hypothetical protein